MKWVREYRFGVSDSILIASPAMANRTIVAPVKRK